MYCISSLIFYTTVICQVIIGKKRSILFIFRYMLKSSNVDIRTFDFINLFNALSDIFCFNSRLILAIFAGIILYTQYSELWYCCTSLTDWSALILTFLIVISINMASYMNSLGTNCVPASIKIMLGDPRYAFINVKKRCSYTVLAEICFSY